MDQTAARNNLQQPPNIPESRGLQQIHSANWNAKSQGLGNNQRRIEPKFAIFPGETRIERLKNGFDWKNPLRVKFQGLRTHDPNKGVDLANRR